MAGTLDNHYQMGILFLISAVLLVFTMRLCAPPDLMDRAQDRAVAYILDVTENGHWPCQLDWKGRISSKPPMYTWVAALFSLMLGKVCLFSIYLPCLLSTIGCVFIIYYLGSRYFGWSTGIYGGLMYLFSHLGVRQIALARTDALFSFTIALAALIAFNAWIKGSGWTIFWIVCAISTLTKGPLGPIIAGLGLLAAAWGRKEEDCPTLRGTHIPGICLFLVVTLGWFALAYWYMGKPVFDTMIGKELAGQSIGREAPPLYIRFWKPTGYVIARYAPWGILTFFGLYRIIRKPSREVETRSLERFLWCWFMGGLLIFSLAKHQRHDLVLPLLVPASVIGGRELTLLIKARTRRHVLLVATIIILIFSSIFTWYYHIKRPKKRVVRKTTEIRKLANLIAKKNTRNFPIDYVNTTFILQYYLGTMKIHRSLEEVEEILRAPEPRWVVIRRSEKSARLIDELASRFHRVLVWKDSLGERFYVLSNRLPGAT